MKREITLKIGGREVAVTAARDGQSIVVEHGEESYTVEIVSEKVVGSQVASMPSPMVSGSAPAVQPASVPTTPTGKASSSGGGATAGAVSGGPGTVPSPMTGVVDKVLVQDGSEVTEGDQILVLEAMKMYIDVTAPASGTVTGVAVGTGDSVKEGQTLMTIG